MKTTIILLCFLFVYGCSSYQPDALKVASMPMLLEQTELPAIPRTIYKPSFRISIKMLIDEKGRVAKAVMLQGSGESEWDTLAVQSIKKWKYEPARFENLPVKMWIVQNARVQIDNPYYVSLAEILCDTYEQATTVFAKLREGKDFGELAALYSSDSSKNQNGYIGKLDVHRYPRDINRILKRLDVGEYTQPMEYGKRFVIFKRLANGNNR